MGLANGTEVDNLKIVFFMGRVLYVSHGFGMEVSGIVYFHDDMIRITWVNVKEIVYFCGIIIGAISGTTGINWAKL